MKFTKNKRIAGIAAVILLACTLVVYRLSIQRVPDAQTSKEVVVLTHNAPGSYYVGGDGEYTGLEYDLATLFVKELGPEYRIKFVNVNSISAIIPKLKSGKAHFAAANLTVTEDRAKLVTFGPPYLKTQQYICYDTDRQAEPKTIESLFGKHIHVPAGSSYAENLKNLKDQYPQLTWQEITSGGEDELIEQVTSGLLDYTITDAHIVSLMQNYYSNLGKGIAVSKPEEIAWAFPKHLDPWLYEQASRFFARIEKDGTLNNLVDRYYGHADRLNTPDVAKFLSQIRSTLPKYSKLFKEAQELTDLDWRLIAAISYQESHWDQFNTSPTNVRGMMMLTEKTADEMGVTDRLDPKQSIFGGARYINQLKKQIPARIPEPDRTWMTLAAYNIGFSHLEDARVLAAKMKLNPDSWADLKTTLPLLNKAEYYTNAKFGYANGGAPVIFVESIRTYFKILEKYESPYEPMFSNFSIGPSFRNK
jgi:membrane-bound lytic murein transglycosylase F